MNKSYQLFRNLSVTEKKQLEEFASISLFNSRNDVKRLLSFWISHPKNTEKEASFAFVFPKKKFISRDWYLLNSRLFKLVEQFLAVKEFQENTIQQKLFLGKTYRKRKLTSYFNTVYQENKKLLKNQSLRDGEWLQANYQNEDEYYDFIASHNRKSRTNLQELSDGLDDYYFANKLKNACLALSRQTINQEDYQINLVEEVISFLEKNDRFFQQPIINVYYYCYKAITDAENERWFPMLRQAITKHQDCFPPSERRDVFMLATNYCIRRVNTGSPIFIREAFELYRLSLDAGYLLEDGVFPESTFGNIVSIAGFLKEFEWAENFVNENQRFLKPVFQEPLYFFSMGRLFYEQGQYNEALESLIKVETKGSFLLINARVLQLKIFFEQKEIDVLDSMLDSFRVYLQRRKDLGYHKRNYELLIAYIRKMLDLPIKSQDYAIQLKEEVATQKKFTEKAWVIAQIEAFI